MNKTFFSYCIIGILILLILMVEIMRASPDSFLPPSPVARGVGMENSPSGGMATMTVEPHKSSQATLDCTAGGQQSSDSPAIMPSRNRGKAEPAGSSSPDTELFYKPTQEALDQEGQFTTATAEVLAIKAERIVTFFQDRKVELEDNDEALADPTTHRYDQESDEDTLQTILDGCDDPDARLQALYMLSEVAPERVASYTDDADELIRNEAEWLIALTATP